MESVIKYIGSEGTCKCGLGCPFKVEDTFSFDISVTCHELKSGDLSSSDSMKFCSSKHKLTAVHKLPLKNTNVVKTSASNCTKVSSASRGWYYLLFMEISIILLCKNVHFVHPYSVFYYKINLLRVFSR